MNNLKKTQKNPHGLYKLIKKALEKFAKKQKQILFIIELENEIIFSLLKKEKLIFHSKKGKVKTKVQEQKLNQEKIFMKYFLR